MNLYWPTYKKIESEVEMLTGSIMFSDDQLSVYSMDIATLIIRCAIEIEAIAKELYLKLEGVEHPVDAEGKARDLYFDTDCMQLLVDRWCLDRKEIIIHSSNMYFSASKRVLLPLEKANERGKGKWKKAYQAIKHNRSQSMKMATVENLLNALGALYILNLYFKDESFWYESPIKDRREYNAVRDSIVFSPQICDATHISMGCDMGDSKNDEIKNLPLENAIYIIKFREDAFRSIHQAMCGDNLKAVLDIRKSPQYLEYIEQHPDEKDKGISYVTSKIGADISRYFFHGEFARTFAQVQKHQEVILNKHHSIYPELRYSEYISSDTIRHKIEDTLKEN